MQQSGYESSVPHHGSMGLFYHAASWSMECSLSRCVLLLLQCEDIPPLCSVLWLYPIGFPETGSIGFNLGSFVHRWLMKVTMKQLRNDLMDSRLLMIPQLKKDPMDSRILVILWRHDPVPILAVVFSIPHEL